MTPELEARTASDEPSPSADAATPDSATGDASADPSGATRDRHPVEASGDADDGLDRPRASTVIAVTSIAFAVGAAAIDATYAVPLLLASGAAMVVGVLRQHRHLLDYATAGALASVLLHGAMGGGAFGSVAAAGLVVFAWDQADHAFDLTAHLGPDADVTRGELAHATYSFAVLALAGGGVYAVAWLAASQRPLPALVLLLLGGVLLTAALRDR